LKIVHCFCAAQIDKILGILIVLEGSVHTGHFLL
jgi:hypothetical protein